MLAPVGNTGGLIGNFQYQCLMQLSVLPVAFCHGAGATNDEAYAHAAHNALLYLTITTKKDNDKLYTFIAFSYVLFDSSD